MTYKIPRLGASIRGWHIRLSYGRDRTNDTSLVVRLAWWQQLLGFNCSADKKWDLANRNPYNRNSSQSPIIWFSTYTSHDNFFVEQNRHSQHQSIGFYCTKTPYIIDIPKAPLVTKCGIRKLSDVFGTCLQILNPSNRCEEYQNRKNWCISTRSRYETFS